MGVSRGLRCESLSGRTVRASLILLLTSVMAGSAVAGERWMLVYYRQIGNQVNGGGLTVENHLFREDGSPGASVGVTNQFNLSTAIWGQSTADGWHRIEPSTQGFRDVRIYDPPVPTDQTPNFYSYNPAGQFVTNYSFETHWLYLSDDTNITPHPTNPVYHYDLVDGINSSTFNEPPGTNSDSFSLTSWSDHIYQTFVVPDGINTLISCKAWGVNTVNYQYVASIHADNGGPIHTWPQVGPTATSRHHSPIDFVPVIAHWPLNAVQVTPGQRYALKVRPLGGGGFNSYAVNSDNYPDGHLWLENTPVTDRDLIAVVVGLSVGSASIIQNPTSIAHTITEGDALPVENFTVANGEPSTTLSYTLSETASWLSVSPTQGTSTGPATSHTITYDVASLDAGVYAAPITISGNATNSPQTLTVTLTVENSQFAKPDQDLDGDVDITDFGWFQNCLSGVGIAQNAPECFKARLDGDQDVDDGDLAIFMGCLSGADVPADPACDN